MDMADILILTLPSIQTKQLIGHFLPDFILKDLGNIQYESRASCSFIVKLSPDLALKVEANSVLELLNLPTDFTINIREKNSEPSLQINENYCK